MPGLSTDAVLDLLREVSAEVITPRFTALADGEVMEKNPGDLVTVADREAEEIIAARLAAAYPDAVILGEEAHAAEPALLERYLAAEHAFTVDPVDGTKNFVHGSPDHAVMVAETVGGEAVRAWVYQPQHKVAWVAERGSGTYRDGERMTTRPGRPDRRPAGATSMWALRGHETGELAPLALSWACCGVDYPRLIEGEVDFILYSRSHAWDHAPGTLLLREAGGEAIHPDGGAYGPRTTRPGVIAAVDGATAHAAQRELGEVFQRA